MVTFGENVTRNYTATLEICACKVAYHTSNGRLRMTQYVGCRIEDDDDHTGVSRR